MTWNWCANIAGISPQNLRKIYQPKAEIRMYEISGDKYTINQIGIKTLTSVYSGTNL